MVSDLFRKDYESLTAAGVRFTVDDIVRLNALAVKVKLARNAIGTVDLPRAVFLGKVVLREPTVGHEMWVERVATYINLRENRNFQIVYAFACSMPWRELPDAMNPKRVVRKVFAFARRHLLGLTETQLSDAVDYILFGPDWMAGEYGPRKPGDGKASTASVGVWVNAVARRIPITLEEVRELTASQVQEVIMRADVFDRHFDEDGEYRRALGEYVRAREEIRKSSRELEPCNT